MGFSWWGGYWSERGYIVPIYGHSLFVPAKIFAKILKFIQYFARNWPWYSQRGLHISVSLSFRQKPSDTALLSVIALTTFNCFVSASVTKGELVYLVVTVHWWRRRTHYDVTKACRALRYIPTVHLNNGAPRADLRGIPKHCEVTAKAGRQSTIYTGDFDAIFFITRYWINPYSYSGFLWARCSPRYIEQRFGPRASLDRWRQLTWQATSYKYGLIVRPQITVFLISKHS